MSKTNTGGPAFPFVEPPTAGYSVATGMTLRDYFASKAMQGLLASPHMPDAFNVQPVADKAYMMADAMLKAREA